MFNQIKIDLNLDAGESVAALQDGSEEALYRLVSSVNIACGGHTGDGNSMNQAVELARKYKLNIGAHPSYPDLQNFGRQKLEISEAELSESLFQQIQSLRSVCARQGLLLSHVKPHGALYNIAARDPQTASAIIKAVHRIDPSLPIVGLAGSGFLRWVRHAGGKSIAEAFVDRTYEKTGDLRSRSLDQALISDPKAAARQALKIVLEKKVTAIDGTEVPLEAGTLCIHADTEGALATAQEVRRELENASVLIRPF